MRWVAMPETARISHAERTDRSDRRMLQAAVELIVERGTDKTTLKDVGERAGYSRGLAGYRFGSKPGLYEFIIRSVGETWLADLTSATAGKVGIEAIAEAVKAHRRFCTQADSALRAFYILWFESVGLASSLQRVIAGIHDRRRRDVIAWVEASRTPPRVPATFIADHFNAAVSGIAYQWLLMPDDAGRISEMHDNLLQVMQTFFAGDKESPITGEFL